MDEANNAMTTGSDLPPLLSLTSMLPITPTIKSSKRIGPNHGRERTVFGDISNICFEQAFEVTKADQATSSISVAILHQFDFSNSKWTSKLLSDFAVPNMEDPVMDGQF